MSSQDNFAELIDGQTAPNNSQQRTQNMLTLIKSWRSLAILLIILLGGVIYSNTLQVPFLIDDNYIIVENPILKDLHYFTNPTAAEEFSYYGAFLRTYVGMASFALNYWWSGLEVTGYHLTNIAIHIANALLILTLLLTLFKTPALRNCEESAVLRVIAVGSALFFLVHPLQTMSVTYIYERVASLVTFFYLAAFIFYIKARLAAKNGSPSRRSILLISLATLSAIAGIFTKPNLVTLPVMLLLAEALFFTGPLLRRSRWILPLLLPHLLFLIVLSYSGLNLLDVIAGSGELSEQTDKHATFAKDFLAPAYSRGEYFVTQIRVLATYLRLFLFPFNQLPFYDYTLYSSPFSLTILASLLIHVALVGSAIFAYLKLKENRPIWLIYSFGIAWFYLTISIESSLLPMPVLIMEYRTYLPGVGVVLALSALIRIAFLQIISPRLKQSMTAIIVLALLFLSVATYQRNQAWQSELSLWKDSFRKNRHSPQVNLSLGRAHLLLGDYITAERHLILALKALPGFETALINLGNIYLKTGRAEQAITTFNQVIQNNPGNFMARNNLAYSYELAGDPQKALQQYREALKAAPGWWKIQENIGRLHIKEGRFDLAVTHLEAARQLNPNSASIHHHLSEAYRKQGNQEKADFHSRAARHFSQQQ